MGIFVYCGRNLYPDNTIIPLIPSTFDIWVESPQEPFEVITRNSTDDQ